MGPIGSKVIEVKGQIYVVFFLFVPLLLPGPSRRVKFTSYKNLPIQYTVIFKVVKMKFFS